MQLAYTSDRHSQVGGTDHIRPVRHLGSGAHLFHEGDDVDYLYEVLTGTLRLTRVSPSGRRQVIAFCRPGDVVGFAPDGERHCDCDAIEAADVVAHRASALSAGDPAHRAFLVEGALDEIARLQDHFMLLGRASLRERLAAFLLSLLRPADCPNSGAVDLHLPMTRTDIADYLGTSIETVSRAFGRLRDEGVLRADRAGNIRIPDVSALARIASNA